MNLAGISDSAALDTGFDISFVIDAYTHMQRGADKFFSKFFDKLAGTPDLRRMIMAGKPESQIKASWAPATADFRKLRERYLLYPEK